MASRTKAEQEAWQDGYTEGQADEAEDAVKEIAKEYQAGLDIGRKEGIDCVIRALRESDVHHALAMSQSDVLEWLESHEGESEIAKQVAKYK
jgi:hypothetical protein